MLEADPNAFYGGGLAVETYDLFVEANPLFAGDREFYVETCRSEGGQVLELGCGTGRVLEALASSGLDATGIDLSGAMLAAARRRLGPDAKLLQADMRAFDLGQSFATVLITCRAFHHVVEPDGQRETLRCVRRHLQTGGLLVLDLFDPLLSLAGDPSPPLPPPRELIAGDGRRYRRTVIARANEPSRQLVSERLRIEAIDDVGGVTASEETSWSLRWLMRQETGWLLELCGFAPVACYSDFQLSPPAYGREQLWLARAV